MSWRPLAEQTTLQDRVLDYITLNPKCTTQDIADALHEEYRRVNNACRCLMHRGWVVNISTSGNHKPRILVRREDA